MLTAYKKLVVLFYLICFFHLLPFSFAHFLCPLLTVPPPSERRSRMQARISVVTYKKKQLGPWLNYGERGGVRNRKKHWLHCV